MPGRFSQSRAKRHFRRMEVLHIRPRRFFENKGFCGFAKQNARMQRAGRPLPEAGAVLRSKMPACSGQAAENCLDRGTQANLSGGTKRLCPAILDAEDGKVPPIAAVRLAAGAGRMLRRSHTATRFYLLVRLRLWQPAPALSTAGKKGREGEANGCAPPCGNAKNAPAAHAGAAGAEGRNTGGTVPGFIPSAAAC